MIICDYMSSSRKKKNSKANQNIKSGQSYCLQMELPWCISLYKQLRTFSISTNQYSWRNKLWVLSCPQTYLERLPVSHLVFLPHRRQKVFPSRNSQSLKLTPNHFTFESYLLKVSLSFDVRFPSTLVTIQMH